MSSITCPKCSKLQIVKFGTKKTKTGVHQRYRCGDCAHVFTLSVKWVNFTDKDKRDMEKLSSLATGVRDIAKFLERQNHTGVYFYLKKT